MGDFATQRGQKWKVKAARKVANLGMVSPATLNIEDTNIANLGSEIEKKVKQESSKNEHQWDDAGKEKGTQIWRIEKFQVVDWPVEEYGNFYSGDSYIVLETYKENDKSNRLSYNIFFWLGKHTSIDEAGTAAYKVVELDTRLQGLAVQAREVQDYESAGFKKLFPAFKTMEGGMESGFNHVEPMMYQTRLLQCKGVSPVICRQVEVKRSSLNSGDVFILDKGLDLYQFNGKDSRPAERAEAAKVCLAYKDERGGKPNIVVWDEAEFSGMDRAFIPFWQVMGGEGEIKPKEAGARDEDAWRTAHRALWRLHTERGDLQFSKVSSGKDCSRAQLAGDDVWVFDAGYQVFAWIGMGADRAERDQALKYAQQYMSENDVPANYPCQRILQGGENEAFEAAFSTFA